MIALFFLRSLSPLVYKMGTTAPPLLDGCKHHEGNHGMWEAVLDHGELDVNGNCHSQLSDATQQKR